MHLRLYTDPVVQIGGGTDTSLPVYRCAIEVDPISDSGEEVSNTTIRISRPGAELRSLLALGPVGVAAELRDDAGAILFAGVVQSVSWAGDQWSVGVEV